MMLSTTVALLGAFRTLFKKLKTFRLQRSIKIMLMPVKTFIYEAEGDRLR